MIISSAWDSSFHSQGSNLRAPLQTKQACPQPSLLASWKPHSMVEEMEGSNLALLPASLHPCIPASSVAVCFMSSLLRMVSAVLLQDEQKPRTVLSSGCIWMPGWGSASALRGYGAVLSFRPCLSHHMSPTAPLPDSSIFEFVILFNYVSVCIPAIIFNYAYVCMPAGWYMHMRARPTKAEGVGSPWRRSYRLL